VLVVPISILKLTFHECLFLIIFLFTVEKERWNSSPLFLFYFLTPLTDIIILFLLKKLRVFFFSFKNSNILKKKIIVHYFSCLYFFADTKHCITTWTEMFCILYKSRKNIEVLNIEGNAYLASINTKWYATTKPHTKKYKTKTNKPG
jgi:hypothetical protein